MQAPSEPQSALSRFFRRGGDSARGKTQQAFELKGMVAPLTVLRLRSSDMALIERQLRLKVSEMPLFFRDAPVLLDLGALGPAATKLPFDDVADLLRGCGMVPVAVTNAEDDARARARAAGFGYVAPTSARTPGRAGNLGPNAGTPSPAPAAAGAVEEDLTRAAAAFRAAGRDQGLGDNDPTPRPDAVPMARAQAAEAARVFSQTEKTPPPPPAPVSAPSAAPRLLTHRPPVIVRQPVRSGQIIYAEATDLVILAPVNPGAEVIADGHVHIYATLRGRAVAGAQGLTEARIFCQKLESELVAIAGAYLLSDDLPADRRGKASQVLLEEGVCKVVAL